MPEGTTSTDPSTGTPTGAACTDGTCRRKFSWGSVFLSVVLLGFIGYQLYNRRTAPVPEVFDRAVTLQTALDTAGSDRPVFALLTADWCGACQVYKRNALAERETAEFLVDRTVPVYVDFDKNRDDAVELARRANLGDSIGLPMSILLEDGRVVGVKSGVMSGSDLRTWIDRSVGASAGG